MALRINEPVWYVKAKKKAIVKEILKNGLVRITYFDPRTDDRQVKDVLVGELQKYQHPQKKDTVLFAKVRADAVIPSKRHEDGCYDVYANFEEDELIIKSGETVLVPTGIASSFSPKYRINLARERGSTGKIGLQVLAGQIDSGFRGEWFVALHNSNNIPIVISKKVDKVQEGTSFERQVEALFYPYSKAICQAAIEFVPNVNIKVIPYEELEKIPSQRGKTMLGQSGK